MEKRVTAFSADLYVAQMASPNRLPLPIAWLSFVLYHSDIGCHSCSGWQCAVLTHGSGSRGQFLETELRYFMSTHQSQQVGYGRITHLRNRSK